MLESFSPSLWCPARRIGFDREGLMHSEPVFTAKLGEGHRREHFVGLVTQHAGPDDPLWLDDFAKDAVHPMVLAEAAHAQAENSAVAEVHLAGRHGEVVGRKPAHQVSRLGPRREDERAGRLKELGDPELAIANGNFGVGRHRMLSFECVRYSPRRPRVCVSPSTAPNALTVWSRIAADSNSIRAVSLVFSPSSANVTVI